MLFANGRVGWRTTARARQSVFSSTRDAGSEWGGQDLVEGIDRGPGSNQPVHHLRMTTISRRVKRGLANLRCEARQEVKRESLCCLC